MLKKIQLGKDAASTTLEQRAIADPPNHAPKPPEKPNTTSIAKQNNNNGKKRKYLWATLKRLTKTRRPQGQEGTRGIQTSYRGHSAKTKEDEETPVIQTRSPREADYTTTPHFL
ncbi:hypothetical protein CHS0354_015640 [Potamilus streckersoni]|uniref:Uncharacterized protein n=1 Tax=Potamilus streckersoni TaxID=2493646 RepID=A0AAE0VTV9_9BIVA|nr:hypothetical protein CHS0354_015640 [Potamilus streckersoni]